MKKHLPPFLIALLLFISIDSLITLTPLNAYFESKLYNWVEKKWTQLETDNPKEMDVLFLGTSRTLNGFAAGPFETMAPKPLNAFNMGVYNGDYFVFKLLLEDYIRRYGKPKLILLEATEFLVNPDFFSDGNILYYRTLIAQHPKAVEKLMGSPVVSPHDKTEVTLSMLSAFYRYRLIMKPSHLTQNVLKWLTPKSAKSKFTPWKLSEGWLPLPPGKEMNTGRSIQESAQGFVNGFYGTYHRVDTAKLSDFLAYCHQNQLPVVLVEWPSHPAFDALLAKKGMRSAYQSQLKAVAQQYQVDWIDLSTLKEPPQDVYFTNPFHLSDKGGLFYTQAMANRLFQLSTAQKALLSSPQKAQSNP